MKHVRGLMTTTKALQRTFLSPLIDVSRPSFPAFQYAQLERQRRFYRPPPVRDASQSRPPPAQTPQGMVVDEKIRAKLIQVVDEDGSLEAPKSVRYVLQTFDRLESFLVQMAPETAEKPAVCKIISKKKLREQKHAKEKAARVQKKSTKQIELNWTIDPHDLSHRLKQLETFLSKGQKVELVMARKKGKRRATPEEARGLVATVREKALEMDAGEYKAMHGKAPDMVTMFVERKGKAG